MGSLVEHTPVMLTECMELLEPRPGGVYVDATLGGGGHSRALCEAVGPSGKVIALDRDPSAIAKAQAELAPIFPGFRAVHGNFADLLELVEEARQERVDGVLMDLGISSLQLDPDSGRGFSFHESGPLDMRMDPTTGASAADVLATIEESELARLLYRLGDERHARRVARAVCKARTESPLRDTERLAEIVRKVVPPDPRSRIDPATRTFMALRIYVNDELGSLARGLREAVASLAPGGRLVVLAYHSGEDRIVKRFLAQEARGCVCPTEQPVCTCGRKPSIRLLSRRPLRPTAAEVERNPRARSCRLRAASKLAAGGRLP